MERIDYPYLNDKEFLLKVDTQHLQKQYTKITLLNWDEKPIQEVQGIITSGSLTINGDSAIRRTGNLSVVLADDSYAKITEVSNLFSINKKIFLEVGIVNTTGEYNDYPILWFPQGLFVINNASASHSSSGTTLNLSFKDKMCLLSGDCGGTLSDTIEFHRYDTLNTEGQWVTSYPVIYQIILELVNHLGKEDMSRIYIADIDTRLKKVMKWMGNVPVYIKSPADPASLENGISTTEPSSGTYKKYEYGQDIGFVFTDFIWTSGELVSKPGDTVVSILDKIKNMLGNYEYFYDVWGNFHFQEVRNYLNISQATYAETGTSRILIDFDNIDYNVFDLARGKAEYDFSESPIVLSYSNNPAYNKIKNDYVVWGQREGVSGTKLPIRYHLAIDEKPRLSGKAYDVVLVQDGSVLKAKKIIDYESYSEFPETGSILNFYRDLSTNKVYTWDADIEQPNYILYSNLPFDYDELEYISSETDFSLGTDVVKINSNIQITASFAEAGNGFGIFDSGDLYNTTIETNSLTEQDTLHINLGNKTADSHIIVGADKKNVININKVVQTENNSTVTKLQVKVDDKDISSDFINTTLGNLNHNFYLFKAKPAGATSAYARRIYNMIIDGHSYIPCKNRINNKVGLYNIDTDTFIEVTNAIASDKVIHNFKTITPTDWRTELYMQAIENERYGLKEHAYAAELEAEWPKIYDLVNQKIFDKYKERPEELDYWLDFIDTGADISKISVNAIGRRTQSKQDDKVNCIFEPMIPDIVFIETGQPDTEERRHECEDRGQRYVQVDTSLYEHFVQGGWLNSAYYEVQDMLYQGSSYNESVSLSTLPIYYLEPNTIITAFDKDSDVHGDYLVKSISIPLGVSGTSNISAQRALNKF